MDPLHNQHAQWAQRHLDLADRTYGNEWKSVEIAQAQVHALLALYYLKAGEVQLWKATGSTPPGTSDS